MEKFFYYKNTLKFCIFVLTLLRDSFLRFPLIFGEVFLIQFRQSQIRSVRHFKFIMLRGHFGKCHTINQSVFFINNNTVNNPCQLIRVSFQINNLPNFKSVFNLYHLCFVKSYVFTTTRFFSSSFFFTGSCIAKQPI